MKTIKQYVIPSEINKEAWELWEKHHLERTKKQYTSQGLTLNWNQLVKFSPFEQLEIIKKAIIKNWAGIGVEYWKKNTSNNDAQRKIEKDKEYRAEQEWAKSVENTNASHTNQIEKLKNAFIKKVTI